MLTKLSLALALGFALFSDVAPAYAVACAAGVYHAGCVGPHGAVVTTRPAAPRCYLRAGVRVCR
jgi:hypothetical protein